MNSRHTNPDFAERYPEARRSVLTYGMPDFTASTISSPDEREQFRQAVEAAVRRFEPRLREVQVDLHESENRFDRTLRMTIRALLWVEPNPSPIAFDTIVQPASGTCKVESH